MRLFFVLQFILSLAFLSVVKCQNSIIQFYYLKTEFSSYNVNADSVVTPTGSVNNAKLMMHNVPLRDTENGKEIGSFSFFETITIRNNYAWIDALGIIIIT